MWKLVGVFSLAALVVLGSTVLAQNSGPYQVYGQGHTSCGTWVTEHATNSPNAAAQLAWVLGFVSGYGYTRPGELNETGPDAVTAWIGNYCQAYPLESLASATGTMVHELRLK